MKKSGLSMVAAVAATLLLMFLLGVYSSRRCATQRGEWRFTHWPQGVCFAKGAVQP